MSRSHPAHPAERDFFIDNLLVRINLIIEMIEWTGLVPGVFEVPFPGSLTSTFLAGGDGMSQKAVDSEGRPMDDWNVVPHPTP